MNKLYEIYMLGDEIKIKEGNEIKETEKMYFPDWGYPSKVNKDRLNIPTYVGDYVYTDDIQKGISALIEKYKDDVKYKHIEIKVLNKKIEILEKESVDNG